MPRIRIVLWAVGALALVVSCTDATSSPPAAPSSVTPTSLAPPLGSPPIDVSAAKSDPCSLLPPALQDKFGVEGPGISNLDDITGPSCAFPRRSQADPVVTVGINIKSMGLEGLYQRRSNFTQFEPITVAGYPGAIVNPRDDPEGCILDVAVNDSELILVGLRRSSDVPAPEGAACEQARQIVADVLAEIQE